MPKLCVKETADSLKEKIGLWLGAKGKDGEYINGETDILDFLIEECGIKMIDNVVEEE